MNWLRVSKEAAPVGADVVIGDHSIQLPLLLVESVLDLLIGRKVSPHLSVHLSSTL
jgi:hypothetical protein